MIKTKKILSLVTAAAVSATAIAGMVFSANAAEDVLWSDTFDGYENTVAHSNTSVGDVLLDGSSIASNMYAGIEGLTLYTTGKSDDSSYYQLTEDANGGKALTTQISRFSNAARGASMKFGTWSEDGKTFTAADYSADSTKDLVLAFKLYETNDGGTTRDNAIEILSKNSSTVVDFGDVVSEWTNVKVVVTSTGTSVYVGDSTTAIATSTQTSITGIQFIGLVDGVDDSSSTGAQKSSSHPFGYPQFSFDDMVVYTTDAGNGLDSTVPAAETHGAGDVTYETVPEGTAPDGMYLVSSDNFNDRTTERLIYIGTDGESTYDINTATLRVGPASDAAGDTRWSIVGNSKTDPALGTEKYLKADNAARSTSNRGPKLEFNYGEIAERETVVAQFATRLHAGTSAPAEVVFSGDLVASESKGNLASPLALITTDATAASGVYACDNPLTQGGENVIEVADDTWVLVTITAYRAADKTATAKIAVTTNPGAEDEDTTYIFGSADSYATMQDSTKSGIYTLPYVSFRSGNDTDYGVSNSSNDIDNIAVYSSSESEATPAPTAEPTPSPTARPTAAPATSVVLDVDEAGTATLTAAADTNVVVIVAHYAESGALEETDGVKSVTVQSVALTANTANTVTIGELHAGDKVFVWNTVGLDGYVPCCEAYTAKGTTTPAEG